MALMADSTPSQVSSSSAQLQTSLRMRLVRWLVLPSARISELDQRRQAILLSGFLLGLITLGTLIEILTVAVIEWENYTGYRQTFLSVSGLLVVYFISRTHRVQLAAVLAVVVGVIGAFFSGLMQPRGIITGMLDYLIVPLWLGSLYIDVRRLSLLIAATIVGLLMIPLLLTGVSINTILVGPFSFLVMTSLLLLLLTHYRNQLEQDRRVELDTLLVQVQQSNSELSHAYDSTIEAWSRMLDLRDKETEGHSRRVTELTLRLAQGFGFSAEELVHIRRGALLHDIGKMGVPDRILLKDGPLAEEEWAIMRMHPVYAYTMLEPIGYLRPALAIPYCHHEKWDG
ncbi:MAG: HD domain-containing protein, partial [Oscillochloris sp.]|nr:HD domain-containing protein [Oscillochloris sp.]